MVKRGGSEHTHVLLVEGQDDRHVIYQLLDRCVPHAELPPHFGVIDKNSFSELLESVSVEINAPGREVVGIMVDANDDPQKRWDEIKHKLETVLQEPPYEMRKKDIVSQYQCKPGGLILKSDPCIGVWMMPDNGTSGELEDFVMQMIPKQDPVWPLARGYINGISDGDRKFHPGKMKKAELFAWLAARREPGRMGAAIGAGDLSVDGPLAKKFLKWLSNLFGFAT